MSLLDDFNEARVLMKKRRVSDGQTFRVTSKGENNATPRSAGLDMRQVSAEEYELTGDAT